MRTVQEVQNRIYEDVATKSVTFAGGTTNDMGDFDGTGNPHTLFNVTGTVAVKVFAQCTTELAGASATVRVGTAITNAGLIASTTATEIDANEIWHDASPDASTEALSVLTEKIISQDVIQTVGVSNVTSGALTYTCLWKPISQDGRVEAA